jgi:hypothetical protein
MVKITQESVSVIVLPTREPLGILLDACVEEERGVMVCWLDTNRCLDWAGIDSNELSEVGFAELTHGRGAVHHQEGTVALI